MSMIRPLVLVVALALGATGLSGCASSEHPYNAAGYSAHEKNGRLYVFVPGSGAEQAFLRTGEMAKSVTVIGKGPNGMTIVADPEVNVDKYVAAVAPRAGTEKK